MTKEEFAELYVANNDLLVGFVRKHGVPVADSEDVAHEVWLKCFRSLGALRDRNNFHAWLFRVARNQVIDFFRSRKHWAGQEPIDEWGEFLVSMDASVEDRILIGELRKQTDSERVLQIFQMRLLGWVEEEIATEMQTVPVNIRSLFHRFAVRVRTVDSSISYRRQR
ncbi:MAG: sigma-70 family RNA polymerase sigma factor [Candidatus Doudnabacteria bacterium]|nr:sigma-70 family RNA polymerase sigma factor [Candidatus Doudnabacteria bacterium]